MNALELADRIDELYKGTSIEEAATVLRQLYAKNKEWEVAEQLAWNEVMGLKAQFVRLADENNKLKDELDTANKAYMWMDETYNGKLTEIEELKSLINEILNFDGSRGLFSAGRLVDARDRAEEILRKAQEK